jgi:hypothetical protein
LAAAGWIYLAYPLGSTGSMAMDGPRAGAVFLAGQREDGHDVPATLPLISLHRSIARDRLNPPTPGSP